MDNQTHNNEEAQPIKHGEPKSQLSSIKH